MLCRSRVIRIAVKFTTSHRLIKDCNIIRNVSFKSSEVPSSSAKIGLFGYCLLSVPVLTFCLGSWQVQRRKWKMNLIKSLEEKITALPIDLPDNLEEIQDLEYRRIKVKGRFDHSREMYIRPRSLLTKGNETGGGLISSGQSGAFVVTPFTLSDRELTILVNRGWVNKKQMNPLTRQAGQVENEIEIVGVVRHNEKRAPFVPHNTDTGRFWHYRDIDSMAAVHDTMPIFIDADFNSTVPEGPIGGQTRVSLRNEHFSYIITWYSLSIVTLYLWQRKFLHKFPLM